jgi:TctA family transporter
VIGWLIIPVLVLTVVGYCWQIRRESSLPRGTAAHRRNVLWQVLLFLASVALSIALMRVAAS